MSVIKPWNYCHSKTCLYFFVYILFSMSYSIWLSLLLFIIITYMSVWWALYMDKFTYVDDELIFKVFSDGNVEFMKINVTISLFTFWMAIYSRYTNSTYLMNEIFKITSKNYFFVLFVHSTDVLTYRNLLALFYFIAI